MNSEEARRVLQEAIKNVDLVNLGRTIYELDRGYKWKTFDNSKWRPNKKLALKETQWLVDNAQSLLDALRCLKSEG